MKLVTLKVFHDYFEANLVKSRLEYEGITCFLWDENITSIDRIYHAAMGGIKLNVPALEVERAVAVLNEIENTSLESSDGKILKCPDCQSIKIALRSPKLKGFQLFLFILQALLALTPIKLNQVYRCDDCGAEVDCK